MDATDSSTSYPPVKVTAAVAWAVIRRPGLWPIAVAQMFRLSRRRWWMRAPFLPIPSRDYVAFRAVTQYGGDPTSAVASIRPEDVVDYLRWCRDWPRSK